MVKYWAFIGCLALIAVSSPSFAAGSYYVELGQDASAEATAKQWNALVQTHKALLSGLHFFPKTVMESGSEATTRIQAGPIDTKDKAQKICTRMFKENVSCFVIEGLGDAPPPTKIMNMASESLAHPVKVLQLPWLPGSEVAPPAPVAEVPAAAPAVEPKDLQEIKPLTEAPVEEKKAQVHVAEAIRVPLTQEDDQQKNAKVVVDELPAIQPTFSDSHGGDTKYADESADSGPGWLVVESFPAEEIATSFWEEVRHGAPKEVKKLRIRIVRPLSATGHAKASLNIGPFASSSEAYDFCRKSVQASARGLTCRFLAGDPGKDEPEAPRHRLPEKPVSVDKSVDAAASTARKYWIQVASAASQGDALQEWENVKSENDDIVHGLRNSVSVSAQDKNTYVVRLGPMDDHDEAIHACAQLQGRGVDCEVVLYLPGKK